MQLANAGLNSFIATTFAGLEPLTGEFVCVLGSPCLFIGNSNRLMSQIALDASDDGGYPREHNEQKVKDGLKLPVLAILFVLLCLSFFYSINAAFEQKGRCLVIRLIVWTVVFICGEALLGVALVVFSP